MSLFDTHLLSLVLFTPVAFVALLVLLPAKESGQLRVVTFLGMLVDLVLAAVAYARFDAKGPEFQLEYRASWLDLVGTSYHLGVDGLSVSLVLLTAVLGPLVVLASWTFVQERTKEFHIALLLLQTAMLGALCSLDLLLFYVFWEAMLIPMYLLVGVWGSEERQMAAMKFFLYTVVGSLLMLVALLAVTFLATPAGQRSFDYASVYNGLLGAHRELSACLASPDQACAALSPTAQALRSWGPLFFAAFALAFAIKVPMWPFHTWLPDAHVQAPVAGSMILAGVMLKMGSFGFWRYAIPLFPAATQQFQPLLVALSLVGIVYGALMCLAQRDIKKLIAYSSVSHLGFCMLGMLALTHEGATGSAYQMLNHGVSTGALFLLFGMLYERRHVRLMADYGGIAKVMPVFTAFFLIITFSSIAVPGTNGFVGEFLVLVGTFKSSLPLGVGVLAASAVVLGAAYMLWMVQKVFFGQLTHKDNARLADVSLRELVTALPFVVLVLVMGLYPQPFLEPLNAASERFVARAQFGAKTPSDDAVRISALALGGPGASRPSPVLVPPAPPPPQGPGIFPGQLVPGRMMMLRPPEELRPVAEPAPGRQPEGRP